MFVIFCEFTLGRKFLPSAAGSWSNPQTGKEQNDTPAPRKGISQGGWGHSYRISAGTCMSVFGFFCAGVRDPCHHSLDVNVLSPRRVLSQVCQGFSGVPFQCTVGCQSQHRNLLNIWVVRL